MIETPYKLFVRNLFKDEAIERLCLLLTLIPAGPALLGIFTEGINGAMKYQPAMDLCVRRLVPVLYT